MDIQIWDNLQMKEYISKTQRQTVIDSDHRGLKYKGFRYFGPGFLKEELIDEEIDYLCRLNPLYGNNSERNLAKDQSVVSLVDSEVNGILSLIYGKFYWDSPHYKIQFLDVCEDSRHRGVATALIRRLNEPSVLSGKSLAVTNCEYSALGRKYAKHVLERDLTGKQLRIYNEETGRRIK